MMYISVRSRNHSKTETCTALYKLFGSTEKKGLDMRVLHVILLFVVIMLVLLFLAKYA